MCCFVTFRIKHVPLDSFTHHSVARIMQLQHHAHAFYLHRRQGRIENPFSLSLSHSSSYSCYLLIYVYSKHTMRDSSSKHKGPWYNLLFKRSFEGRGKEKIYKETIKLGNTCIIINTSTHTSSHTTYKHLYARMCAGTFLLSNQSNKSKVQFLNTKNFNYTKL